MTGPETSDERPENTGEQSEFVRTYTLTGGRTRARHLLSVDTVLQGGPGRPGPGLPPECQEIVALCREHQRSVAELAGWLGRPVTAVKVLVSDLLDADALTLPISTAFTTEEGKSRASTQLLVAAMAGLRKAFPDAVSYRQAG
ncbi:DUF742 domain-containing protein [Streptomyces rubradiris]|uniref:DUF742 domain-containing protein n=1 Tax=Streptomyces rubradiris TaxID=285531 RepID=A0ABQ3RA76_STRRR|nr:DUF742 domain-containing protein [Streptomyces rubradiris]GHH25802.1 hypothetical protein GCM10018792_65380 [Streptomyces rubradiris]GHI52743.1 hypothetical protein Srubr_25890 [Streptomyces rubradiris]